MFLRSKDAVALDAAAARIESTQGVRIATAIVGKSDAYPELPWKAFALACALASLGIVLADALAPQWVTADTALLQSVAVLAAGIAAAAAAIVVPPFARLFLRRTRRDQEVRQHAQALFLRRELFAAPGRRGVLMLVSRFERKVVILPDTGFDGVIDARDWSRVIARMTPLLVHGSAAKALEAGLDAAETLFAERGLAAGDAGAQPVSQRSTEPRRPS